MISKRLRWAKWLWIAVPLTVVVLMTVLILRDRETLLGFSWQVRPKYLALSLLLHSIALGATFVVWHLMISCLGGFGDLRSNLRLYYLSTLAKRVPTPFWYVGSRILMYREMGVPASSVISCIVLENVLVGFGGIVTLLGVLPFHSGLRLARLLPLTLTGCLAMAGLLIRPRAVVDATNWVLRRLDREEIPVVPSRAQLAVWSVLYVVPWLFAGGSFYCATHAVAGQVEMGLIDAIGISTISMLIALVAMMFPAGIGVKELTSSALLARWVPLSAAIAISIAFRLLQTLNEVMWALSTTMLSSTSGRQ